MTEASLRIEGSSSESFVEVDWLHQQPVYAAWSSDSGWTVASSPRDLHRAGHPGGLEWARVLAQPLPSDWPLGFAAYERGVHVLASGQGYFLDRTGSVHPSGLLATRSDRSEPLTVATLDDRLRSSVRALKGRRVGLLLSGGLDSGLLAALLADESVPYAAACVADPENVRDVQHAVTLCAELGVDLTVVEPSMEDFLATLPVASSAFEDARPDVFRAMGLIFGAHALKTHRCDVVIGGEPADDVLGSSRVFFDASNHGPMTAEVLARRGHQDSVPAWVDRYVPRLIEIPRSSEPIDHSNWPAVLGNGKRIGDWAVFFTRQVTERPWADAHSRPTGDANVGPPSRAARSL